MSTLKRLVRSPQKPLQQIVKRLKEIKPLRSQCTPNMKTVSVSHVLESLPIGNVIYHSFKKLWYKGWNFKIITDRKADCYFFSN